MKPYKYIYDIWSFLLFIEHTSWCKSNQVSALPNNTINFILMISVEIQSHTLWFLKWARDFIFDFSQSKLLYRN